MYVKSFRIENFRRLKNVRVDLDVDTTIFVGANNSGKTSATHVFQRFLDPKSRFQIYDFTADCWDAFDKCESASGEGEVEFPKICFDLWFEVDDENVHRVVRLLPGLDWNEEPVGVRMVYEPRDSSSLLANYEKARNGTRLPEGKVETSFKPWPRNLFDYLDKQLTQEYEIKYYVLDRRQCDAELVPKVDYEPFCVGSRSSGGADVVSELIRVDFLNAQRHLADADSHGRAEDLSRRLSRYYQRNLPKFEADLDALSAITDSEASLNQHFTQVFESVLKKIGELGYPGIANPGLVIKTSFNAQTILSTSARVHYALPDVNGNASTQASTLLPDQYNGLGFKNLIYMAVEILDFHHAWEEVEGERPPVHLIMIEEPEAHLHAQLQQVFIRKVSDLLPAIAPGFQTQMVVTTHSSHILYERSFKPIRYFCRAKQNGTVNYSDVKDLSLFYDREEPATRTFLQKYLKLTHCDLLFADAAILVEGNVERLLVPLIIERRAPELRSCHLTILEVGGAFAHKFQKLLEFLELTTLVITDLDSVTPLKADRQGDGGTSGQGESCMTTEPAAVTSNPALERWFSKQTSIEDLLDLPEAEKVVKTEDGTEGNIRVSFQTRRPATWLNTKDDLAGRTLEEAFALENLAWTQEKEGKPLGLGIQGAGSLTLEDLHSRIFKRVQKLDKTRFALGVIAAQDASWTEPQYIVDGLIWLHDRLRISTSSLVTSPLTTEGE